jgi:3-oxoacyl-[acyl-carrier-protein] synthase-3
MAQRYARITGWGKYLPARRLTNYDLEQMMDTSDEWISSRTGIRERRIAAPEETTVSMALQASQQALDQAGVLADELDMVILATTTPDYLCPASASMLQDRLGSRNAGAFDVVSGCTGWLYGLTIASQFVQTGAYDRVLVVGAETISRALDWTDRSTSVLFGDGAGAVVVEPSVSPTGVLSFELGSDGAAYDALICPGGGSVEPFSQKTLDERLNYLRIDGKRIAKFAVRNVTRSIQRVIQRSGLPIDDINFMIPHQSSTRLTEMIAKRLKFDMNKVMVNVDRYANTSAAALPIALSEAVEQERIQDGDHILLMSFGAGLTWASAVVHWEPTKPESEQAILVTDWPIQEQLRRQAVKVRNSVWQAQVTARTKAQEASTTLMVPFYSWQRRRRKAKEKAEEGES